MKKWGIAVVGALLVLALVTATIINKDNVESEIENGMIEYAEYLKDKEATLLYDDKIVATYEFLNEYSHKNKEVQDEVTQNIEDEINYLFEQLFEIEILSVTTLEGLGNIVKENYISQSNVSSYNIAYDEAKRMSSIISNATDEDIEKVKEYNANNIEIGSTEKQVLEKLGNPDNVTKSNSALGESKVYEYENKFIYINNGIVSRVVEF